MFRFFPKDMREWANEVNSPERADVLRDELGVEVGAVDDREPHVHQKEAEVSVIL